MTAPVIEVEGLRAGYGERTVLTDVGFTVAPGEILAVMGGSGSGKTTLLNHLLGLRRPLAGTVRVLGRDINALDDRELGALRRRVGVAFQSGALLSSLTLAENVALPLRELTAADEAAIRATVEARLAEVALVGAGGLRPDQLSGGMVKRGALARALVMDPELLFCDEPTAGLDPPVADAIDELILELRRNRGTTIVVVTHDLATVFHIADRVLLLDAGEVLAEGDAASLRQSPDPRVRALLSRRSRKGEAPKC